MNLKTPPATRCFIVPSTDRAGLRRRLAAALLCVTALSGFGFAVPAVAQEEPARPAGAVASRLPDFSDLVSQVRPAVVSITNHLSTHQAAFRGHGREDQDRDEEARGAGFLIDPNGTIVTNYHVVKDAQSVTVMLLDGTELVATVVGTDQRTDLAVLHVDAGRRLPFVALGNSSQVRPGQWVIAMGNPFGLEGSVSAGIVSASGRNLGHGPYDSFIQVDAPMNQGNSGGPLFAQDGTVIGVDTAILSPTGGSIGIGFAIPSEMVAAVVKQLVASGHVSRGFLGVSTQTPPASRGSAQPSQSVRAGALVVGVKDGSPATRAGLLVGDIITAVDGHPVANPHGLGIAVAEIEPGHAADLEIMRNGESRHLSATIVPQPEELADLSDRTTHDTQVHPGQGVRG